MSLILAGLAGLFVLLLLSYFTNQKCQQISSLQTSILINSTNHYFDSVDDLYYELNQRVLKLGPGALICLPSFDKINAIIKEDYQNFLSLPELKALNKTPIGFQSQKFYHDLSDIYSNNLYQDEINEILIQHFQSTHLNLSQQILSSCTNFSTQKIDIETFENAYVGWNSAFYSLIDPFQKSVQDDYVKSLYSPKNFNPNLMTRTLLDLTNSYHKCYFSALCSSILSFDFDSTLHNMTKMYEFQRLDVYQFTGEEQTPFAIQHTRLFDKIPTTLHLEFEIQKMLSDANTRLSFSSEVVSSIFEPFQQILTFSDRVAQHTGPEVTTSASLHSLNQSLIRIRDLIHQNFTSITNQLISETWRADGDSSRSHELVNRAHSVNHFLKTAFPEMTGKAGTGGAGESSGNPLDAKLDFTKFTFRRREILSLIKVMSSTSTSGSSQQQVDEEMKLLRTHISNCLRKDIQHVLPFLNISSSSSSPREPQNILEIFDLLHGLKLSVQEKIFTSPAEGRGATNTGGEDLANIKSFLTKVSSYFDSIRSIQNSFILQEKNLLSLAVEVDLFYQELLLLNQTAIPEATTTTTGTSRGTTLKKNQDINMFQFTTPLKEWAVMSRTLQSKVILLKKAIEFTDTFNLWTLDPETISSMKYSFDLVFKQQDHARILLLNLQSQLHNCQSKFMNLHDPQGSNQGSGGQGGGGGPGEYYLTSRIFDLLIHFEQISRGSSHTSLGIDINDLQTSSSHCVHQISEDLNKQSLFILNKFDKYFQIKSYPEIHELISTANSLQQTFQILPSSSYQSCYRQYDHMISSLRSYIESIPKNFTRSLSYSQHAHQLVEFQQIRSEIGDEHILKLIDRNFLEYIQRFTDSNLSLHQLGMELKNIKGFGEDIVMKYDCFHMTQTCTFNALTESMTLSHGLSLLQELNPETMTSFKSLKLKYYYETYAQQFDRNLQKYLEGYQSITEKKPLTELIKSVHERVANKKRDANTFLVILADIFSVYSILKSSKAYEETHSNCVLIKPHVVQILGILRMFGLSEFDDWKLSSHLVQVKTGEGKSIFLGGASCLLALYGLDVYVSSYSSLLSQRDFEDFKPLFDQFGVTHRIKYSTLRDLVETIINSDGDVREIAASHILANPSPSSPLSSSMSSKQRVLLLDEVDVCLTPDFYGQAYIPAKLFVSNESRALLKYIWEHRDDDSSTTDGPLDFEKITQLPEYHSLLEQFHPEITPLINAHINQMTQDVKDFQNPPYVVVENGGKSSQIGYKHLDTISVNEVHGYKTAFAYLYESQNRSYDLNPEPHLGFYFNFGLFSYAEMPKSKLFKAILGVTGTLTTLRPYEKEILQNDYRIKDSKFTIMPSLYGNNNLVFHTNLNEDVILAEDLLRFHQQIYSEIIQEAEKKRPVLVFFETEKNMTDFMKSEHGILLKKYAATNRLMYSHVTEKTSNVKWFVEERSTKPNAISLWTTSFGRGTDFKVVHQEVDNVGGVTVILTTFCSHPSDCVQYQGRTARQGKKGTFKMILLKQDLQYEYQVSNEEIQKESQSNGFLSWLESRRNEKLEEQFKIQKQRALSYSTMHSKSEEFRRKLISSAFNTTRMATSMGTSTSTSPLTSLTSSLIEFSGVSMSHSMIDIYHVIFCLDESGSMSSSDWKALMKAYLEFLKTFQLSKRKNDKFSVIQFAYSSRVIYRNYHVDEAISYSLSKSSGGTEFFPPLEDTDRLLSSENLATKYLVIFMTDGDNTDQGATLRIAKQMDEKYRDKIEFYGIGFKEIDKLKNLPALVQCFRNGHLKLANDIAELEIEFKEIATSVTSPSFVRQ